MKDILGRVKQFLIKIISTNWAFFILCAVSHFTERMPWYGFLISGGAVLTYRAIKGILMLSGGVKKGEN